MKRIQRIRNVVCPAIKLFVCVRCGVNHWGLCGRRCFAEGCWFFVKLLCVMLKAGGQPSWALSWLAHGKIHCIKVPEVQKVVVLGWWGVNCSEYRWQIKRPAVGSVHWVKSSCVTPRIWFQHGQGNVLEWLGVDILAFLHHSGVIINLNNLTNVMRIWFWLYQGWYKAMCLPRIGACRSKSSINALTKQVPSVIWPAITL